MSSVGRVLVAHSKASPNLTKGSKLDILVCAFNARTSICQMKVTRPEDQGHPQLITNLKPDWLHDTLSNKEFKNCFTIKIYYSYFNVIG